MSNGVLLLLGIGIVGGLITALIAQRAKIPQVLGYIVAGLILGESGFRVVTVQDIAGLEPFNNFALGIIGFLVGSELKFATLKKYAPQFSSLLIGEGVLAFLLVTLGTTAVLYSVTNSLPVALSGGIVLGAIASATDPASTISVLWENRTAGILTTTIIAIIALDDALAMVLYGLGSGIAQILAGGENVSIASEIGNVVFELGGSALVGVVGGYLITLIMKQAKKAEHAIALSLGIILLLVGISVQFHFDIIIVTMMIGVILANVVPTRSEELIEFFKTISLPIYAVFFVLIGARITIGSMPGWLWGIVGIYVLLRSIGKYAGAMIGAKVSNAAPVVQKYTGLGLFAQGGVAIGLSIMAAHHFREIPVTDTLMLSDVIVFTVASTTLFVQIIGPFAVRLAAKKSGEMNRDLTEEDILADNRVNDCTSALVPTVAPGTSLLELFELFTKTDALAIPVVDKNQQFLGTVSMAEAKELFLESETWQWVIVNDIMNLKSETITPELSLAEGVQRLSQLHTDQLVVQEDGAYKGILDSRLIRAFVRTQMVQLRSDME